MNKKLLAVLLGIVMIIGLMTVSAFAADETTAVEIGTPEALIAFAEEAKAGNDFSGVTVNLTADIDMSDYYWYQRSADGSIVSDYRIPVFAGTLNGNGYTISNLKYEDLFATATEVEPLAFIVEIYNSAAVLKNISIETIRVNTAAPARFSGLVDHYTYWSYSGETGYVDNCTVSDIVVESSAQLAFGGLIHKTFGMGAQSTGFTNCHVNGFTVNANGILNGLNDGRCGGFIATGGEVTSFTNCSVTNFTVNAASTGTFVGGFMGGASMTAKFINCDVNGFSLNATERFRAVGGFAAYTAGSAWGTNILFEKCNVSGLDVDAANFTYGAGGFIGCVNGQSGHIFDTCTASGSIAADTYIGGFAGWLRGRTSNASATFTSCTTSVNVTDNNPGNDTNSAPFTTGGFVGNHTPASGNVCPATYEGCLAWGDVCGVEPVGSGFTGIVGGTYNYDPENVDETTGDVNNVAVGFRALDNGDGTWTVFEGSENVVKLVFHRWNNDSFEAFRTIEVFNNTSFVNGAYNNAYSGDTYRFATGLDMFDEYNDNNAGNRLGWTTVPAGNVNDFNDDTVVELTNEGDVLNVYPVMSVTGYKITNTGDSNLTIRLLTKSIIGNWIPGTKIIIAPGDSYTVAADGFVGAYIGDSLFSYSVWSSGNIPDFLTAIVDYISNSFYGEGEFDDGTNSIKVEPIYDEVATTEAASTYGFNIPGTFGGRYGFGSGFGSGFGFGRW